MYLEYWGIESPPFDNAPNPDLFYPSPQHEEALSRLLFAVTQQKGVAMLTGEVGCGKTTVSRAFTKNLAERGYEIRFITNPALDPVDFLKTIQMKFGGNPSGRSKAEMIAQLTDHLTANEERGVATVLIIDEAHVIENMFTFDEIRMLLNIQSDAKFLINLVLMGQPPLREKIRRIPPLRERISVKYHLKPLNVNNTMRYLIFRMKSAGAQRGFFTKQAISPIFYYSKGNPLRINNVCDRSLLLGMLKNVRVIGPELIREAIADLT